jgi:protein BCP1
MIECIMSLTRLRIALKRLLRQSLSHDEEIVDVHPLASLILSEGVRMSVGSSIKTDGEESDPWGLVAIIDIPRNKVDTLILPVANELG